MDTVYQAGATSKIVTIRGIVISTGLPYTAGAFNTAGLVVHYTRDAATVQTITAVTAVQGTYTASGFVHRTDGAYEIGAPTASLAAGSDGVEFSASGVTDVYFTITRVELVGTDPRSSATPDVNVLTTTASALTSTSFAAGALNTQVRTAVGMASANLDTQIAALQADTDNIQTRIPTALSGNGNLKVDVKEINDVVITGSGTLGLEFHP